MKRFAENRPQELRLRIGIGAKLCEFLLNVFVF